MERRPKQTAMEKEKSKQKQTKKVKTKMEGNKRPPQYNTNITNQHMQVITYNR